MCIPNRMIMYNNVSDEKVITHLQFYREICMPIIIQFNPEMISKILKLWWLFTVRLSAFRHTNIRNADHLSIEIKIMF